MATLATANFGYQNFFSTTLTSDLSASALDIFLDDAPTITEGTLVIDPNTANAEVIFFNSKTSAKVTCPSLAGRGYDSSTAVSHAAGAQVIMAPVADWFTALKSGSAYDTVAGTGWKALDYPFITVQQVGPRLMQFTSGGLVDLTPYVSAGMRFRQTRSSTAPTQCADFESTSSQYATRTSASVSGITFTDDYTMIGWIKLESYTGSSQYIVARDDGTNGWGMYINGSGQLVGYGRSAAGVNQKTYTTYQSIPLNQWVHVAVSMDLSGSSGIAYIDGEIVPGALVTAGALTAITNTGDLSIGRQGGVASGYFDGRIAEVSIHASVLSQTVIRGWVTTYGALGAASFRLEGGFTDSTGSNTLTAVNSAIATFADHPWKQSEYGIVVSSTYSGSTSVIVYTGNSNIITTAAGTCSTSFAKAPLNFPASKRNWAQQTILRSQLATTVNSTTAQLTGAQITLPYGEWDLNYRGFFLVTSAGNTFLNTQMQLSTSTSSLTDDLMMTRAGTPNISSSANEHDAELYATGFYATTANTTPLYLDALTGGNYQIYTAATSVPTVIEAVCAYV
jgi:hypothetical protein